MLGQCYQLSHSYPGIYTVHVPAGPPVTVIFGSKLVQEDRPLYKVFSSRLYPPVNITADIPDCRASGSDETILKVNDIMLDASFAPSLCSLENASSAEERLYESLQGNNVVRFQGYLDENSLGRFFHSDSDISFVTQVGHYRGELSSSFSSPGIHTVTVPEGVSSARVLVVGGGGGGGAGGARLYPCYAATVGGGGGGAGGSAFGDIRVTSGDNISFMVGQGGSGGQTGDGGGDGISSLFKSLTGVGGKGGGAGSTNGPGQGGRGGGASGPMEKNGANGHNGAASRGGAGGLPYFYDLYKNGAGGAGGSFFGDDGKPGENGLVHIFYNPSASVEDLSRFLAEYKQLAERCGLFSILSEGPMHLYAIGDDDDGDENVVDPEV
jgi:hypothetical protein